MLLITGITGHTGQYFLQELIRNNYKKPIRCVVREASNTSLIDNSGLNIEKVIGDLNDEKFLDVCMQGISTVFHIVNIRYSPKIIKIAIKNKVQRAVLVHTTGIYSEFRSASEEYKYIESKIKEKIQNSNIQVTIIRPTMIYGDMCDHNISRFIRMIGKLKVFPVIDHGKGLIQPVNARDLGKAYYKILMMPSEKIKYEYNLSGDKPITMIEAFKLISKKLGKKTIFISVPLGLGVFMAKCFKILSVGKIDYIEKIQRMSEDRAFSHSQAKKDFDYTPEPFEIGIDREVKEYLNS
jgi:nucleoside-diphosphate-sugar epimerase